MFRLIRLVPMSIRKLYTVIAVDMSTFFPASCSSFFFHCTFVFCSPFHLASDTASVPLSGSWYHLNLTQLLLCQYFHHVLTYFQLYLNKTDLYYKERGHMSMICSAWGVLFFSYLLSLLGCAFLIWTWFSEPSNTLLSWHPPSKHQLEMTPDFKMVPACRFHGLGTV